MSGEWIASVLNSYATYIGILSATIMVGLFTWKKGIKPVLAALKQYHTLCDKVDTIFDEMTPNGGTSIKDRIERMDTGLSLVQEIQQAMAADTKAVLFRTDANGDCVWVNRTYTRTVGRDLSEILGHGWQNTIAQDDRERVVTEWYNAVEENREFILDYSFETPEGEKTLVRGRGYKLVDSKGDLLGYWGNCQIL